MATEDLYASLTRRKPDTGHKWRLGVVPPLAVGAVLASIIGLWIVFMKDPLGGEPRVVVAIAPPQAPPQPAIAPATTPAATPKPIVAGVDAAPDENTVSIITPGGANGMQVRNVPVPSTKPNTALAPAPDPRLVEKSRHGLLPRIGADGAKPARIYARPTGVTGGARIAILIGGLGLSQSGTADAIIKLPADITFAFAPYGTNLQSQVTRARAEGHEVMLQVPMEPYDYPTSDPGPHTLLTSAPPEQNLDRLHWSMSRFSGYTGVTNYMGAKFSTTAATVRPMMQELRQRGLLYVDDGSAPRSLAGEIAGEIGVPHQTASLLIDAELTPDKIDEALAKLETQALKTGLAIGVGSALPLTIDRLARWSKSLENKNITLVPLSATATGERP